MEKLRVEIKERTKVFVKMGNINPLLYTVGIKQTIMKCIPGL